MLTAKAGKKTERAGKLQAKTSMLAALETSKDLISDRGNTLGNLQEIWTESIALEENATTLKTESKRIDKADTLRMKLQTIIRVGKKYSELSTMEEDLEMARKEAGTTLILIERRTNMIAEAVGDLLAMKGIMKTLRAAITLT